MIDLKSYFHNKYQGGEDFIENVILPIFGKDKYEDAFEEDVLENNPELTTMASAIGISQVLRMGTINIPMNPTDVFDITVSNHVQMERNRVAIQSLVRRIMSTYSSAFMVFHYDDDTRWDWRFTFCSKKGNNQESTDSKRYTFLMGPNQSCRTAAENFKKLADKCGDIELEDIVKAFDVESLSKEFFEKYKVRYGRFVGYVIGKEYIDKGDGKGEWHQKEGLQPSELYYGLGKDEKVVRDYVKKLLGRIVFLHFLQKKGWLGSTDENWKNGPQDFMLQLYEKSTADQQDNFLDEILEPLFSCLDTPLTERREVFDTKVDGLRSVRVPFLGGLFERNNDDKAISVFPSALFADLFKFLSEYNFTIDENDPNDAQVGVDPEMLGRIFENLLEDNKDKGAFYTPKEIVQYMCRESLIAYLQTDVTDEPTCDALRQFVTTHDVNVLGGKDCPLALNVSQCLKNVKICDPAIGSGAFPMGLLNELFFCRGVIEDFSNAAAIKRHIIQQNIYGVDIEKGAVEIARLRFWLSLITDADTPEVLPNMDFKIMQGNSLLEQYKGFDLSHIMDTKHEIHAGHQYQMFEDQIDVIRAEVKRTIQNYYGEQNHDVRRTMREGIQQQIQQQIRTQGYNVDISDIKDIAATDQFFLWHTWFGDVFEKGGFDIVIGNPPYIQLQSNGGALGKLYQNCGYETFASTGDIYSLFYEKGWQILKEGGHLCFITSNKWMRAGYGEKTRQFFTTHTNPKVLIDFAGLKIFESATVDTNILIFAREKNSHKTKCVVTSKESKECLGYLSDYVQQYPSICDFKGSDSWVVLSPIELSIKKKIESIGTPLKDWNIQINYGIKTGFNDAFIITTEKRDEILSNCMSETERRKTADIIRPILRGRDIKRYGHDWSNLWLINTHNGVKGQIPRINIEDYPAIKAHLDMFWDKIKKRADKGDTPYNLRNCAYLEDFDKPKIVYPDIAQRLSFSLSTDREFLSNTAYFFHSSEITQLSYLLKILNSKLIDWYYRNLSVQLGEKAVRMFSIYVLKLPIPQGQYDGIIELISEDDIDKYVYNLYGLSTDEIAFIETL